MKVILQNFSRGQIVFHSDIAILKGQLVCDPGEEEGFKSGHPLTPGNSPSSPVPFEIWQTRGVKQEETEVVPHLSYKNRFVCLVKLEEGGNQFKFWDKESSSLFDDFELIYRPEENTNENYMRILYVVSAKEEGNENGEKRVMPKLQLGLSLAQSLFGEKLYENGFDRRSFKLRQQQQQQQQTVIGDDKHNVNVPSCEVFRISKTAEEISQLSTSHLWEYIAKEIRGREDVWDKKCKYIAFVSNSWKVHYDQHHHHRHQQGFHSEKGGGSGGGPGEKLALGGGGLAIIGTSFLDVWPHSVDEILNTVFSPKTLWNAELENCAARFGAVDRTEGSLYAASLGSVLHEMGHVFDLGHTDAGLMGSQFNRIDTCLSPVLSYPPVCELFRPKLGYDLSPILRPKVGLPNNGCLSEDLLSIGISCATLLYFHKWFQPNSGQTRGNRSPTPEEKILLIKNKVVSKTPLVTLQVRDTEDERLLKSWTFVERSSRECGDPLILSAMKEFTLAKNHIPIPVCQRGDSNKALVVAEDCDGNLVKTVVSRDSLSESFTVIRRRT